MVCHFVNVQLGSTTDATDSRLLSAGEQVTIRRHQKLDEK
jgi:hypothetical protein